MVRRHTTSLRAALMLIDFGAAMSLFVLVSMARYGGRWQEAWHRLGADPWLAAAAFASGWVILVWLQGLYRIRARWSLRSEAAALVQATAVLALSTVVVLFVVQISEASRLVVGVLFLLLATMAIGARIALRALFAWLRRRGHMTRFVLIVGADSAAQDFADRIARHPDLGLRVIGHLAGPDGVSPLQTRPVIGQLDDIERVFREHVVDEVAVCLPVEAWDMVEPVTRLCAGEGKVVRIPGDGRGPIVAGGYAEEFDGLQLTSLVYGPDRAVGLAIKRVIDIAVAASMLILLGPAMTVIAVAVLATDGWPVLFRQARVGLHGRRFSVLKFRTMVPDAEDRLAEIEALNEVRGRAFKLTRDPRVTRFGSFLRRSSLDELPQLWNVLRGEMSLVGPRPPLPDEVRGYDLWHRRRLSMKPGMTGLWQVSGRHEVDFDRWVEKDLEYIDQWSLWLDAKIALRTVPAVLRLEGR